MKRVLFAFSSTVAGLVMLLSFKTEAVGPSALPAAIATTGPTDLATGAGSGADPGSASAAPTTTPSATPSTGSSSAAVADAVYTGAAAQTRYGPVQVEITVTGGKVTAAQAVDYPDNNGRDAEINARAIPTLNAEAVDAGSAAIDTVSGATYTSDGYLQSLQSALDEAGL